MPLSSPHPPASAPQPASQSEQAETDLLISDVDVWPDFIDVRVGDAAMGQVLLQLVVSRRLVLFLLHLWRGRRRLRKLDLLARH